MFKNKLMSMMCSKPTVSYCLTSSQICINKKAVKCCKDQLVAIHNTSNKNGKQFRLAVNIWLDIDCGVDNKWTSRL